MDLIVEQILNFLQFDVANIFNNGSSCCLCCLQISQPKFSMSLEKCIANVYEPRPAIFNNEEETCALTSCEDNDEDDVMNEGDENCELEEFDCESESECDCEAQEALAKAEATAKAKAKCNSNGRSQPKCPAEETKENDCEQQQQKDREQYQKEIELQEKRKRTACDIVCKQIVTKIAEKCSSSTLRELQCIEERATKLWTTLNQHARPPGAFNAAKCPHWWHLKPWQKLPFYWAALSNEILSEDPFENFKRFYLCQNNQQARRSSKRQHESVLIVWHGLNTKQRMPFIMEAFIGKVGAGKVNINDEHEIQKVFSDLQNKCC